MNEVTTYEDLLATPPPPCTENHRCTEGARCRDWYDELNFEVWLKTKTPATGIEILTWLLLPSTAEESEVSKLAAQFDEWKKGESCLPNTKQNC